MRPRVVQGDCARCEGRPAKPHHGTPRSEPACRRGCAASRRTDSHREHAATANPGREKCRNIRGRRAAAAGRRATLDNQDGPSGGRAVQPNRSKIGRTHSGAGERRRRTHGRLGRCCQGRLYAPHLPAGQRRPPLRADGPTLCVLRQQRRPQPSTTPTGFLPFLPRRSTIVYMTLITRWPRAGSTGRFDKPVSHVHSRSAFKQT